MTDLVIAYYNEKNALGTFINYANKYKYNIVLYNKGDNPVNLKNAKYNYKILKLKNIGQATHTYLHHIIENYNNLSNITIFMLGSGFRDGKKARKAHWILKNANNCKGFSAQHIWLSSECDYNFELPYYEIFNYKNNNILQDSKRIRTKMIRANTFPLGKWIEKNTEFKDKRFYRTNKCMFSVTKDIILKKPLSYYKNLIKQLELSNRNLEVIHFFERAWICVFLEPNENNDYYKDKFNYDTGRYGKLLCVSNK